MDFYLSFNNGIEQLRLPVNPSSFQVSQKHNNTVIDIANLGELNLIGKTGLTTFTISSFFPATEYYFCKYTGFPSPYECVKMIQNWKKQNKPIRLIITETLINYAVSIESFVFSEDDGTRDVNFTLELREYIFIQNKSITSKTNTPIKVPETKRETKEIKSSYTVKKGDTLYAIAKKMTGDASNYKAIANKNSIKNPNKIYVGQVLIIG